MPALFIFLLKVNLALIAFCLGYYLVLRKLTFYTLNRFYLALGIIFSSVYPFVDIDSFLERFKQLEPLQQAVVNLKAPAEKLLNYAWYWNWAALIFWVGAGVFAMRLVVQFISLYRIYRRSEPGILQQYNVRITDADISPFSFWRSIFINPENIEDADLKNILQHEQVHVSEWHTLDILLAEISVVFYWFNPGIWLVKKAVSENIEFITDRKILQQGMDSKVYQYSLLNVSLGFNAAPNITNHFNFSTLKKRICMMNASRSSNINLTRYAVLVPAVVACLCVFSISKANIADQSAAAYQDISTSVDQLMGGPITEVVVKAKRKIHHKFFVQFIDTAKTTAIPLTFQFKADSVTANRTFEVKKVAGQAASYTINGKAVSAEEFNATRPHAKMDTINISARYPLPQNAHEKRTFMILRTDGANRPDNDRKKGQQDELLDNKHIDKIMVFMTDKDSAARHTGRVIRSIRINGKKATQDELNKIAPSMINDIRIIDDKKPASYETKDDNGQAQIKTSDMDVSVKNQ